MENDEFDYVSRGTLFRTAPNGLKANWGATGYAYRGPILFDSEHLDDEFYTCTLVFPLPDYIKTKNGRVRLDASLLKAGQVKIANLLAGETGEKSDTKLSSRNGVAGIYVAREHDTRSWHEKLVLVVKDCSPVAKEETKKFLEESTRKNREFMRKHSLTPVDIIEKTTKYMKANPRYDDIFDKTVVLWRNFDVLRIQRIANEHIDDIATSLLMQIGLDRVLETDEYEEDYYGKHGYRQWENYVVSENEEITYMRGSVHVSKNTPLVAVKSGPLVGFTVYGRYERLLAEHEPKPTPAKKTVLYDDIDDYSKADDEEEDAKRDKDPESDEISELEYARFLKMDANKIIRREIVGYDAKKVADELTPLDPERRQMIVDMLRSASYMGMTKSRPRQLVIDRRMNPSYAIELPHIKIQNIMMIPGVPQIPKNISAIDRESFEARRKFLMWTSNAHENEKKLPYGLMKVNENYYASRKHSASDEWLTESFLKISGVADFFIVRNEQNKIVFTKEETTVVLPAKGYDGYDMFTGSRSDDIGLIKEAVRAFLKRCEPVYGGTSTLFVLELKPLILVYGVRE